MSNSDTLLVTKADGDVEPFRFAKLRKSLERSGASADIIDRVAEEVEMDFVDRERTVDIYRKAFRLLRKYQHTAAARYSLKRAVLDLGPTGYPFEDLLTEIFRVKGYDAHSRILYKGACVEHELDVVATKDNKRIGVEVKFHNSVGLKSDVKVTLYVKSRFDDIAHGSNGKDSNHFDERWIVTNTKFTSQAEEYGLCAGLTLVSWSSPAQGNLQDLIEDTRVHPLTCLTSLSAGHKRALLNQQVVLCQTIQENPRLLESLGLPAKSIERVLGETQALRAVS